MSHVQFEIGIMLISAKQKIVKQYFQLKQLCETKTGKLEKKD